MRLFTLAADQGDSGGICKLGYAYEMGEGVPQVFCEAALLYRRAAEMGDPMAQANLATCLADGRGVPRDEAAAMQWFRKAAAQNDEDTDADLRKRAVLHEDARTELREVGRL